MSLIAHYRFNGDANDRLRAFNGVPNGSVAWGDAKHRQGLVCNGTDAFINIDAVAQYLHGRPEASIAMWVKKDAIQYGFIQLSGYANSNGNLYPYNTATRVYLDVFRTNRLGPIEMPTSTLDWHHVVITQKPGKWCLYQNGTLVHEASANDTVATDYLNGEIGRNSSSRYADGSFDDVRIYDHALSASEVANVAQGRSTFLALRGTTHDAEENSSVLTDGVTYEWDEVLKREVAIFNGSNFVRLEQPLGQTGNDQVWAVEALIYRTDLSGEQFLVQGMNLGVKISHTDTNRKPLLYLNSGTNDHYEYGAAGSMPAGQWLHVVFTFDNAVNYKAIYVNGNDVGTGGASGTGNPSGLNTTIDVGEGFKGKMAFFKMYATSLSAAQVKSRFQKLMGLDERGNLTVGNNRFLELGNPQNRIIDYSVWKDDGSIGSVGEFRANGAADKSTRVTDTGPFGEQAVLYQANNTDTASTADGGWNSSPTFPIDNTKKYRFAIWMRRKVAGNGSGYWGTHGYGSVNGIIQVPNGSTPNGNPYFHSGGVSTEWRLYVGFVHPHDYTGDLDPDNGIYDTDGNKITTIRDFKWLPESTTANHRAYLYYSTDVTTVQQFAYPRIDVCDGSEPSIEELIGGVDLLWSQNGFPTPFDLKPSLTALGRVSEQGVTRGLLHYFPLVKDFKDRFTPKVGTPSAVTFDDYGTKFNGTADVDLGTLAAFGSEWTVMCRYRPVAFTQYAHLLSAYNQADWAFKVGTSGFNSRPYWTSGVTGSLSFSTSLSVGNDYHLAIVYKDGVLRQYVNGVLDNQHTVTIASVPAQAYRVGRFSGEHSEGSERDLRVFGRALEAEEVAWQAKWSEGQASMQRTREGVLIPGELCEVD